MPAVCGLTWMQNIEVEEDDELTARLSHESSFLLQHFQPVGVSVSWMAYSVNSQFGQYTFSYGKVGS